MDLLKKVPALCFGTKGVSGYRITVIFMIVTADVTLHTRYPPEILCFHCFYFHEEYFTSPTYR